MLGGYSNNRFTNARYFAKKKEKKKKRVFRLSTKAISFVRSIETREFGFECVVGVYYI